MVSIRSQNVLKLGNNSVIHPQSLKEKQYINGLNKTEVENKKLKMTSNEVFHCLWGSSLNFALNIKQI